MKKAYLSSATAILGLVGAALVPTTAAFAASENAAEITMNVGCTGFVPTSDGGIGPFISTVDGHHRVITKVGNKILSCQFDVPEELVPSTTRSASGFSCGVNGSTTTDSQMLATPGGRAILICKVKH